MENKTVLFAVSQEELTSIIKSSVAEVLHSRETKQKEKQLLNAKEVCELFGIHMSTLNKWKARNKIPFKRLGKRVFFEREKILEAMKDSRYSRN